MLYYAAIYFTIVSLMDLSIAYKQDERDWADYLVTAVSVFATAIVWFTIYNGDN